MTTMPATTTPSMHHSRRWNVAASTFGLKMVTYTKISPKMVKAREKAWKAEGGEGGVAVCGDSWLWFSVSVSTLDGTRRLRCQLSGPGSCHAQRLATLLFLLLLLLPPRWPSGKASASRAEDPGFESRLRRDFFRVESYQ